MRPPNILIFLPHDLGDWLGCCGHPTVRSPQLDQFAQQGVRLSNYFAGAPECTPSRGCMFTGLHCHQHGLMGLSNFGWEIQPHVKHLSRLLAEGSYRTHLYGLHHETARDPATLGYQQVEQSSREVTAVCAKVTDFLQREASGASTQPWMLCAGFTNVHRPWKTPRTFAPDAVAVPGWIPDTPAVRADLADFHTDIEVMDRAIGSVLMALERTGQADDTLVIFTSDHGVPFPRAKATLYDPGLRIAMLARWPRGFAGGRVLPELLCNVDLTPTLLDLCCLPIPPELSGRSFAPLLRGESYAEHDAVFATLYYDVAYDPMHALRTARHRYIRSFAVTDEDRARADPTVLATHAAGAWIRVDDYDVMSSAAWRSLAVDCRRPVREELYDMQADPGSWRNLVDDPAAQDVLLALRQRMEDWMRATDSPLLRGHVAPNEAQRKAFEKYQPGGPMYARLQ